MLSRHLRANAVAYAALFVALGGTSYAAIQLPANSVGKKQLKKNAVRSAKVKDGSLRASDFALGQLPAGPKGDPGPRGNPGPQGDPGIQGVQGPAGPTFGSAKTGVASGDPPASPDLGAAAGASYSFTLPSGGPVLLRHFVPSFSLSCTSGVGTAGLYVDGQPVPNTSLTLEGSAPTRSVEFTAIVDLAAGAHSAAVRGDCASGDDVSRNVDTRSTWMALLLGGA